MVLAIASPSKINLYLKVRKRRVDGYHELETLFLPLDAPVDRITLEFTDDPGIRVSSSQPGLPKDLANLAGRAAQAYADQAGIAPAWKIDIEKTIPVAAGMGGGSSNAASCLRLLNDHYRKLNDSELAAIALKLGADVPFFLNPRLAVATGVGEILRYPEGVFHTPPLLFVSPRFPVSAKWAYQTLAPERIGEDSSGKLDRLIEALKNNDLAGVAGNLHNDFSAILYEKFPLLAILRDFMLKHGALGADVTGSGPTLYAICKNQERCAALRAALQKSFQGITVL